MDVVSSSSMTSWERRARRHAGWLTALAPSARAAELKRPSHASHLAVHVTTSPTIHGDNRIDSGRRTHRPSPAVGQSDPSPTTQARRAQFRKRAPLNAASRAPSDAAQRRRGCAVLHGHAGSGSDGWSGTVTGASLTTARTSAPNAVRLEPSEGAHDLRPWMPPAHTDRDRRIRARQEGLEVSPNARAYRQGASPRSAVRGRWRAHH
jgi:hypothetical protein